MALPARYRPRRMGALEAEEIRQALEELLTRTDADGNPVPGSTQVVALPQRGGWYQIAIQAEHVEQLMHAYQARIRIATGD